ncbi:MAG: hypothetical protein NDJ90_04220 [Oligoflexia bacterium]|nr:hypothetical protein [Oligoflexia bacterium]
MRKRAAAVLVLVLLATNAFATTTFSGLAGDAEGSGRFVVGLRSQARGASEVASGLLRIHARNFTVRRLALPKAASNREVIALFLFGKQLIAVTQWTIEQGDDPQVHAFNLANAKWTDLGKVACPGVRKITAEAGLLRFSCEEPSPVGETRWGEKTVALGSTWSGPAQVVELPVVEARSGAARAQLLGDKLRSEKLQLKARGKTRTYQAKSFGRLR